MPATALRLLSSWTDGARASTRKSLVWLMSIDSWLMDSPMVWRWLASPVISELSSLTVVLMASP